MQKSSLGCRILKRFIVRVEQFCEMDYGFESLYYQKIKHQPQGLMLYFGPPKGIRTPVLQNRNLLRYPAAPWTEILM